MSLKSQTLSKILLVVIYVTAIFVGMFYLRTGHTDDYKINVYAEHTSNPFVTEQGYGFNAVVVDRCQTKCISAFTL